MAVGAAIAGAASSIGEPITQYETTRRAASEAKDAAQAQLAADAAARRESIAAQREMFDLAQGEERRRFDLNRADLAPWRKAGGRSIKELERRAFKGPGEFDPSKDPGFEFGFKNLVERPLERGASARGRRRSGATKIALGDRAQDYASTKFDSFLARHYNSLTPFQSLAGLGQTPQGRPNQVGAAVSAGQGIGQTITGGSAARGSALNQLGAANAAGANAAGTAFGNVSNTASNALLDYSAWRFNQDQQNQGGGFNYPAWRENEQRQN